MNLTCIIKDEFFKWDFIFQKEIIYDIIFFINLLNYTNII